jgi:hypothetical protein
MLTGREKGLQLIRHYGYYGNKSRRLRRRQNLPAPATSESSNPDDSPDGSYRRLCYRALARRAWARLIRKV